MKNKAFTLIELLVVMSAIVVLMMPFGLSVYRTYSGRPQDAVTMATNMLQVARARTLAYQLESRVAVCIDPNEPDYYLQSLVSLRWDGKWSRSDALPNPEGWRFDVRVQYLPQNTMFDPKFSEKPTEDNTMKLDLTKQGEMQDGTTGSLFQFIEFDKSGNAENPGTQWCFANGKIIDGVVVFFNVEDRQAFKIRLTGRTSSYNESADIVKP